MTWLGIKSMAKQVIASDMTTQVTILQRTNATNTMAKPLAETAVVNALPISVNLATGQPAFGVLPNNRTKDKL